MPKRLLVRLKSGSYSITWLRDIERTFVQVHKRVGKRPCFLITNETLYRLYKVQITSQFLERNTLIIPEGENQKKLTTINFLVDKLSSLGADRESILIAFGGGVVGDITGFLASVYMRGVSYLQIPTTLLAMVDSSVGGKTGVNSDSGKNMIGTFYQPESVWMCVDFLKTLPDRELRCGLAEAVKSALIKNKKFYSFFSKNARLIAARDLSVLHRISYESVSIKKWVVQKDEKERNLRSILNLGHTLAHSLEKYFDYQHISHGEAVSIGICFAAFYSYRKNLISKNQWEKIQELLNKLNLPTKLGDIQQEKKSKMKKMPTVKKLVEFMKNDKKNQRGFIYFVFLNKIGKYRISQKIEIKEIREILEDFLLCQ